ncbi:hypothetical protein [Aeromicrobium sp. UC242_57]|uniref:hypothetical protein n=1 Tax=Aeromicrobium sp. UC242_57 TaxID=3374624 RepID=UPI00379619DA
MLMLPSAIMSFLAGPVGGPIARKIGPKTVVVFGCALGAAGMFQLAAWHAEVARRGVQRHHRNRHRTGVRLPRRTLSSQPSLRRRPGSPAE